MRVLEIIRQIVRIEVTCDILHFSSSVSDRIKRAAQLVLGHHTHESAQQCSSTRRVVKSETAGDNPKVFRFQLVHRARLQILRHECPHFAYGLINCRHWINLLPGSRDGEAQTRTAGFTLRF